MQNPVLCLETRTGSLNYNRVTLSLALGK